jgi:hypothetical protein
VKWELKDDYYLESINKDNSFSISKSQVEDKFIYTLFKIPYNNAQFICRSESLEDVKKQAIQFNKDQSTSVDSKITGSAGLPA